jgi:hypothetical protein
LIFFDNSFEKHSPAFVRFFFFFLNRENLCQNIIFPKMATKLDNKINKITAWSVRGYSSN